MAKNNVPIGVIIISILQFLGAASFFLLGILALVGPSFWGNVSEITSIFSTDIQSNTIFTIMGISFLVVGFIIGLIGYGLLKGNNISKYIIVTFAGLSIIDASIGLIAGLSIIALLNSIIGLGINGLILWYLLFNENTKNFFNG